MGLRGRFDGEWCGSPVSRKRNSSTEVSNYSNNGRCHPARKKYNEVRPMGTFHWVTEQSVKLFDVGADGTDVVEEDIFSTTKSLRFLHMIISSTRTLRTPSRNREPGVTRPQYIQQHYRYQVVAFLVLEYESTTLYFRRQFDRT